MAKHRHELPPDMDEMLSPQQVATALNITTRTLSKMVASGRFPPGVHYTKRTVRWKRSLIEGYMEAAPIPA